MRCRCGWADLADVGWVCVADNEKGTGGRRPRSTTNPASEAGRIDTNERKFLVLVVVLDFPVFNYDYEDDLPASGPLCALVPIRGSTWVAAVVPFAPALSLIRKFLRMHLGKAKKYPLTTSGKLAR